MSEKALLSVIALSTSIVALFCVWVVVNVYYFDYQLTKMVRDLNASFPSSSPSSLGVSSSADLARERAEIERQLNSGRK